MNKNKLLTKDQISEKYKKMRIAAIVGYCLNALLLLLIVLSMVFGSNNASSVSAQNDIQPKNALVQRDNAISNNIEDYFVYFNKYSVGTQILSIDLIHDLNDYAGLSNLSQSSSLIGERFTYRLTGDFVIYGGNLNDFYNVDVIYFVFSCMESDMGNYWRLAWFNYHIVANNIDSWRGGIQKTDDNAALLEYDFTLNDRIVARETEINDNVFLSFFELSPKSLFTFNSLFNFNAPFGGSLNNKFVTISDSETIHRVTYDTGVFLSNGRLYDQIKLVYWHASLYLFMTEDGSYELGPSDMYTFKEMYFHPYGASDSTTQLVCSRDTGNAYISGSWTPYQLQSVTWQNDEFRHILFLQTLSDDLITDINAFNNNTDVSINNYNSGSFFNVFTLVASAISGLMPILNMVILPGVTIGILLFIPLVVMLVFAIIRIIKK